MHYKIISIIVSAILFHLLLVFGIFQQVSMQTPHAKLVRNFHKEMKNEHIKIKNLSKEIKKQPNNYILYLKRADAQIEQQEIFLDFVRIFSPYSEYNIVNKSDIIEDLKKAKELNPNIDNNFTLGIIAFKSEQYDVAIKYFTNYIRHNQNSGKLYLAYYYRGLSYEELYRISGNEKLIKLAILNLENVTKLAPNFSEAYTKLGNIYSYPIQDNKIAIQYYDKAILIDKNNIENYLRKIMQYENPQTSSIEHNLIMSEYYNAINTKNGYLCTLLYSSLNFKFGFDSKDSILRTKHEQKSLDILAKAINNCKYCVVPKGYYEDLEEYYFDIFFFYIYDYSQNDDIDSAVYYINKCKNFAKKHNYGTSFCSAITTPNDEKIKNYKLNFNGLRKFIKLSIENMRNFYF